MQHVPVKSSFITHVAHDPASQTMIITFKNGTTEQHDGVSDVVNRLNAQAARIAELQAQIAAGTPVSQEQLDGLTTEAQAIAAALTAATAA